MKKDESGWTWLIVASCFCIGFLADGLQYSYGFLFIEFVREFKQSKTKTSWIGGLNFGWFMFGPVASILVNNFGCRAVVVAGGALAFIGLLTSVFSTSVYFLYVSFGCCLGFGFLLLNIPKEVIIIQYFEQKRSFAMGITCCGSGIGTIVFNPLTKWLIDEYGWRGTMLIEAGLVLNCVACGLVMRPIVAAPEQAKDERLTECDTLCDPLVLVEADQKDASQVDSEEATLENGYLKTAKVDKQLDLARAIKDNQSKDNKKKNKHIFNLSLFKRPTIIVFIQYCFFSGISYYTPFTFLPDMAVHTGWSRAEAAWLLTAIGIVNTLFRGPIGKVADLKCINRVVFLAVSFCLMGVASAVMPFTDAYEIMMAVCIFFAIFAGAYVVLSPVIVADLFGEQDAADVIGIGYLVFGIGSLISGPVSGVLFDTSGNYKLTFTVAGAGFVLSGIMNFVMFCMSR